MKKILISSTALTAALAAGVFLMPSRAEATTAKETFRHMRSALARAYGSGELTISGTFTDGGGSSFNILLDGQPLPSDVPVHVTADDRGDYVDYTIDIDLSDANFSSISYGKDHNTLRLIPKAAPNSFDVIKLDPKSQRPAQWTTFKTEGGVTKQASNVSYVTSDKEISGPPTNKTSTVTHDESTGGSKPSDDQIVAHIRMVKGGGSASLSVKQN